MRRRRMGRGLRPLNLQNLRRYSTLLVWLALVATVGLVWLLGGEKGAGRVSAPQESLQVSPKISVTTAPSPPEGTAQPKAAAEEQPRELVGLWVPYLSLETQAHTQQAFEDNFKEITDTARRTGVNALFVHVRPFGDALYPSSLYPWSHILTGEQGKDPGFDPLQFMLDYAHANNMEFHAWLNPLRVKTDKTPGTLGEENCYTQLHNDYPQYFMEVNGGVYLNPAYAYVRTLIADGAKEIVEKYEVDGIHFDDYFYPTSIQEEGPDQESYESYKAAVALPLTLPQWRTANISAMVSEVYLKVKQGNPEAVFGISPQGNIGNDLAMGADVESWAAIPGYVDYLCPQLYYSFDNPALGYQEALDQWMALPRHENLSLYAGLGLYKAGTDGDEGTWRTSSDIIRRQIEAAREAQCQGVILYSSAYLDAAETKEEVENAMAVLTQG